MNIPKDKYIRVNQLRLHYLDWGKGGDKTLLLLHGFMSHAHMWDNLASELSARYHVLALDQRGHGDSEWSKEAYYSIDSHFSDISVFIGDRIKTLASILNRTLLLFLMTWAYIFDLDKRVMEAEFSDY